MTAQEHPLTPLRSPVPVPLHGEEGSILGSGAAVLMRPAYLPPSAWTEHLPFAFWLVETLRPRCLVELGTHWGASYFGFCQAVSRFGTNTACYAIDSWQGDEQAGLYGAEVFQRVRDHNRKNYSGFSSLIRGTFNEALPYFQDGSIDLLHIDGLHTYEAVRNDFESWLPKLSDRAVVLLHDTNVRERDFGVFHLFAELRERYPGFEFLHGHGLGVIGVGSDLPDGLRAMFDAAGHPEKTQGIRNFFAHLGENCQDRLSMTTLEAEVARLETVISTERERIKALEGRLAAQHESLSAKVTELNGTITRLKADLQAQCDAATAAGQESRRLQAEIEYASRLLADEGADQDQSRKPEALSKAMSGLLAKLQAQRKKADEFTVLHGKHAREQEQSARIDRDNKRLQAELGELTRRLVQNQETVDTTRQALKDAQQALQDARAATSSMASRFKKLEDQIKAERLITKERIATILDNAQRLIRAFAPAKPSGIKAALSPALKALVRRMQATGLVDDAWYLKKNPDVRKTGLDPRQHYVLYGAAEGRLPRDMAKPVEQG